MIRKIVANGRTGVARGALEAARTLDIPHGGWVLSDDAAENQFLSGLYHLQELKTHSLSKCIERSVKESDGTLIITFTDDLPDDALCARKSADKHHIPWLHINLGQTGDFEATQAIHEWLKEQNVQTIHVLGATGKKAEKTTTGLLEAVYYLGLIESNMSAASTLADSSQESAPESVEEIVSRISAEMTLKDRVIVANLQEPQLELLQPTLGRHILNRLEFWEKTFAPAFSISELENSGKADATIDAVIIRRLWQQLQETHRIRMVKTKSDTRG
jgi:hypothetical protein